MGRLRRLLQPESEEESAGFGDERPESNGLFIGGHQSPHLSRQRAVAKRQQRLAYLAQKAFAGEVDDVLNNVENDSREILYRSQSPGARRRKAFVDRGGLDSGRSYNLYKAVTGIDPDLSE